MTNYQFADAGYNSGYESEEGTFYQPNTVIGRGNYAQARLFKSHTQKSIVVLKPVKNYDIHLKEAQKKLSFFQTLYPEKKTKLIHNHQKNTYRLILSEIPGKAYDNLSISTEEKLIHLFIAAIDALSDCHQKGIILIDLKEDNIHFDEANQKACLIDGGSSERINDPVNPAIFKVSSARDVANSRRKFSHIAPECWSTQITHAHSQMDIYSLGSMIKRLGIKKNIHLSQEISEIIRSCTEANILKRPSLEVIKQKLRQLSVQRNELLKKLAAEDIELTPQEQYIFFTHKKLQNVIFDFIIQCKSLDFGEKKEVKKALKQYQTDCVKLALKGKEKFKDNYPFVAHRALKVIDNHRFKQFVRAVANAFITVLATVSVVGIVAMSLTAHHRGGFMLFQGPKGELQRVAAHLESGLEKNHCF